MTVVRLRRVDSVTGVDWRKPRIGWVLNGDAILASSRLQGVNISEFFNRQGLTSTIAAQNISTIPDGLSKQFLVLAIELLGARFDTVMFQKPTWMMFKLSELLRINGVPTAAIQCDPFPGPYESYFTRVIVTSEALKDRLKLTSAAVIDDMLEVPPSLYKTAHRASPTRLRLVWVGQSANLFVRQFLEDLSRHPRLMNQIEIVTIGAGSWVTHPWKLSTVFNHILDCDVAVLPLPEKEWEGTKSTNRLTQFMALGMPTVASPVRSYMQTGQAGKAFLTGRTVDEFAEAITSLLDVDIRKRIADMAHGFARGSFGADAIGPLWLREAEALLSSPDQALTSSYRTRAVARLLALVSRSAVFGRQLHEDPGTSFGGRA